MATHSPQKPTASELEILQVLWERGPSTVREVHEQLNAKRPMGYTGVLKLMQIMTVKGAVRRNEEQRAHVYEAVEPAEKTKRQFALLRSTGRYQRDPAVTIFAGCFARLTSGEPRAIPLQAVLGFGLSRFGTSRSGEICFRHHGFSTV